MSFVHHDRALSPFLLHIAGANDLESASTQVTHMWITPTAELSDAGVKDIACRKLGEVNIRLSNDHGTTGNHGKFSHWYVENTLPQGLNNVMTKRGGYGNNCAGTTSLKFYTTAATGDSKTLVSTGTYGTPTFNEFSHILCIKGQDG